MEFKISQNELAKALSRNISIAERKSTKPILQNSLFIVENGKMTTFATDLEVKLEATCDADVMQGGSITLPTKRLFDIAKELPTDADVHFIMKDNFQMEVHCLKSRFLLSGLSPEDFPEAIKDDEGDYFELNRFQLLEMIRKTIFAASTEDAKKTLNGVYLQKLHLEGDALPPPPIDPEAKPEADAEEGEEKEEQVTESPTQTSGDVLRMVATDGHRLAMYNLNLEGKDIPLDAAGVIIPRKGIVELNRMLEEEEGAINICVKNNNIIFMTDTKKLSIILVEGTYPDYDRVIPKNNNNQVLIAKEEFVRSLRRMMVVLSDKTKGIKMQFSPGKLNLLSRNPNISEEAEEELDVSYSGSELSLGFNAKYFQEIAAVINSEKILLTLSDDFAPGVIRAAEGEKEFLAVLMPMKIAY